MQETKFNHIDVIQWLRPQDTATGSRLLNDVLRVSEFARSGFTFRLHDISERNEFEAIIRAQTQAADTCGLIPVLHVETHGSPDGIGTGSDPAHGISWRELKPLITRLNVATRNRLLVTMSCCDGGYLGSIIQTTDRSPCWAFAGPVTEVSAGSLLAAYGAFYTIVLNGGSGSAAIAALNSHLPDGSPEFLFKTSRDFFIETYRKYIDRCCTDCAIQQRARDIHEIGRELHPDADVTVENIERDIRTGTPRRFEQHKRHFFMYDLDEENTNRFQATWADVTTGGPTTESNATSG